MSTSIDFNQFPSLQTYLETGSKKVIALYFAASWCPDCTPITARLKSFYDDEHRKKYIDIIYTSSDSTATQMNQTLSEEHGAWKAIPFENVDERNALKRYFKAFAGKEAHVLGMSLQGRHPIPCLILVDCKSKKVLTYNGVNDIVSIDDLEAVCQKWLSFAT